MRRLLSLALLPALAGGVARADQASPPLTMQDLEERALARNPTLKQAESAIRAAEGRWRQAGVKPNPVLGYEGGELTFDRTRAYRQVHHYFYVEQAILTGRKLKRARTVAEHARTEAQAQSETQRQAVRNAVRGLYRQAQVAQRIVDVRGELARIARNAVTVSEELLNVGQADRPDVLEAEIEAERADLALRAAEHERGAVWEVLGAVVGEPGLTPRPLAGDPEVDIPVLDRQALARTLLAESPEIKVARATARREHAMIERTRADRLGDVTVQGGVSYNADRSHGLGGWNYGAEVAFPLPLFNRQQGAVAAARAEAARAEADVARLELGLQARLAREFQGYQTSRGLVERYKAAVIPKAQMAHQLYLARFKEMTAAYPQVLISQRTLFQVKAEHLHALGELWHHVVMLEGFLIGEGMDGLQQAGSVEAMLEGQDADPGSR
jgi:outer membrane protein, heavy metal efflux system